MRSAHLRENGMTYFSHMRQAFAVAGKMALGAVIAAVHGVLPDLFKTRAGDIIEELHGEIERHRRGKPR